MRLIFYSCSAVSISLHVWYSELLLLSSELKNHLSSEMSLLNRPAGWKATLHLSEVILSRKKSRTLKLGKKTHSPSVLLSKSTAKNNVWYYQQVLLRFSVGGKHNTSIGNSANKLMAIFKCCNRNARAIKERSVKHTHTGKDPNT